MAAIFDRLSDSSRAVVDLAGEEATRLGHRHLGTEHLLMGLVLHRENRAAQALEAAGATIYGLRDKVTEALSSRLPGGAGDGEVTLTPRAQRALERAARFSLHAREAQVEPEQVLLGVLDVEGTAAQVLRGLGVDVMALARAMAPPAQGEADVAPAAPVPAGGGDGAGPVSPRCSTCGAGLDTTLRWRALSVPGETGQPRDLVLAYCESCGTTVGVVPPPPPRPRR